MRPVLLFVMLLTVAACEPVSSTAEQSCSADRLQDHVGQPVASLRLDSLPALTRLIGPDTAVTMDYRPERLNVEHDQAQIIQRIFCG